MRAVACQPKVLVPLEEFGDGIFVELLAGNLQIPTVGEADDAFLWPS